MVVGSVMLSSQLRVFEVEVSEVYTCLGQAVGYRLSELNLDMDTLLGIFQGCNQFEARVARKACYDGIRVLLNEMIGSSWRDLEKLQDFGALLSVAEFRKLGNLYVPPPSSQPDLSFLDFGRKLVISLLLKAPYFDAVAGEVRTAFVMSFEAMKKSELSMTLHDVPGTVPTIIREAYFSALSEVALKPAAKRRRINPVVWTPPPASESSDPMSSGSDSDSTSSDSDLTSSDSDPDDFVDTDTSSDDD